ncbi:acetyl-CoA carboxylase biotin carboxylase subunit [Streptomonospora sp. PA3]|nr:acetyl-CoA carboxylase biotin carboxylase subunit [Streptomonospora sp. PA3]MUL41476.1 acetyl-CoA carboxylase biotin carboxylase subunit [Streptomonospora sp. PA3]
MFDTVLVANRGEIALRVIRACRALGVRTVAVHTSDDGDSAVVRLADTSVHIGPPGGRSYLNIPAVIEAAQATGADAIHPGYGFLSEDPDFAEICGDHGITFIGPPSHVMHKLGDKAVSRAVMSQAGVPLLPGSRHAVDNAREAREVADAIGMPVIVKATAGGGGRGMRIVREADELERVFRETRNDALSLFKDSRVYVERFIERARHIEVQVLCDAHGNGVSLGVRDCSVQRRHQKLVEETPSPSLAPETADAMGRVAVKAALAVGYVGVGTFEFIVDEDGDFRFIEINCRIQVEHPVTEAVTGIDLVTEQIRVAAGERLSVEQSDIDRRGVAIECRVNAEDPDRGFVPTPGVLQRFHPPGGPFVRVDTHCYTGYRVPPTYDSLLAKVIAWAPDREQALARLDGALDEFVVQGPGMRTTIGLLREVIADPRFRNGTHTTSFLDELVPRSGTGKPAKRRRRAR